MSCHKVTVEVLGELSEEVELKFGGLSTLVLHGVRGAENAMILRLFQEGERKLSVLLE